MWSVYNTVMITKNYTRPQEKTDYTFAYFANQRYRDMLLQAVVSLSCHASHQLTQTLLGFNMAVTACY